MGNGISRVLADCEIIEQLEIAPHVFRSVLVEPTIAGTSRPGQFVNVRVCEGYDPLLRRPFSIHAVDPERGTFSLLYDVVGRGTKLLMEMNVGDKVSIVGPLGSSFDVGENPEAKHILVAGGCGAAPIHFLSDYICQKHDCDKATVLVGARMGDGVLCHAEFVAHGVNVQVATEDGSFGYKGLVTELLDSHLKSAISNQQSAIRVYSCGPMAMMRAVARVCEEHQIDCCQVSLERTMACGLGVCMGCVTKQREQVTGNREQCKCHPSTGSGWQGDDLEWSYSRVCTDGPVYDAKELVWE